MTAKSNRPATIRKIAVVMPRTSNEREKMEWAGVPAGAKILVEPWLKSEERRAQILRDNLQLRKTYRYSGKRLTSGCFGWSLDAVEYGRGSGCDGLSMK